MKCPNCQKNIKSNESTTDSQVSGFIDIFFECYECEIIIYTLKIENINN